MTTVELSDALRHISAGNDDITNRFISMNDKGVYYTAQLA